MMEEHDKRANDSRIILYRSLKQIVVIIALGVLVKSCIIDSVVIHGDQMSPTIENGDRTLIFRTPYQIPLNIIKPGLTKPVVFRYPFEKSRLTSLRIAATWGDTVAIDSGIVSNSSNKSVQFSTPGKTGMMVPASFSPRDFFHPYQVPKKGMQFQLDSLSLRDFFFAVAVVRQEKPKSKVTVKANLYIDDSLSNDYFINEFSLYKGTFDTISQNYQFDWFFWDRLVQYLNAAITEHSAVLKFDLLIDGTRTGFYTVHDNYVFLLADNWGDGLDSRYIGPVNASAIIGRVFFVLWSWDRHSGMHLNPKRFGRIVK
jgi:signal peptidase I